jgi:hypothetical protein
MTAHERFQKAWHDAREDEDYDLAPASVEAKHMVAAIKAAEADARAAALREAAEMAAGYVARDKPDECEVCVVCGFLDRAYQRMAERSISPHPREGATVSEIKHSPEPATGRCRRCGEQTNLFRYCAHLDHPMAPTYCETQPHPECATCTEELWPAGDPEDCARDAAMRLAKDVRNLSCALWLCFPFVRAKRIARVLDSFLDRASKGGMFR